MRNYHLNKNTKWCKAINLDRVWSLVSENVRQKSKARKDGKVPVIDVVRAVSINFYIQLRRLLILCLQLSNYFVFCFLGLL